MSSRSSRRRRRRPASRAGARRGPKTHRARSSRPDSASCGCLKYNVVAVFSYGPALGTDALSRLAWNLVGLGAVDVTWEEGEFLADFAALAPDGEAATRSVVRLVSSLHDARLTQVEAWRLGQQRPEFVAVVRDGRANGCEAAG